MLHIASCTLMKLQLRYAGLQVLVVAVGALGGTAAYAGGSLLSALQKEF